MVSMPCLWTKIQPCSTIAATMAKMFYFLDWYKGHDNLPFIKTLTFVGWWFEPLCDFYPNHWWMFSHFDKHIFIFRWFNPTTKASDWLVDIWIYDLSSTHSPNMCLNIPLAYRLEYRGVILQKDYSKNGSPHWSGFKLLTPAKIFTLPLKNSALKINTHDPLLLICGRFLGDIR